MNSANYTTDIDDQSANNYIYDSIGNLTKDVSEEIDSIIWNVYGKIERVVRTASSERSDLEFRYDAMGNRICKIVKPRDGAGIVDQDGWTYTYYLRDASGNVIAVYDRDYSTPGATYTDEFSLKEDHLYGSSRVGIRTIDEVVCTTTYTYGSTGSNGVFTGTFSSRTATAASTTNYNHELKRKAFELSNHLGNVLVTVSDARTATNSSGTVSAFTAVLESAQDYYAFGSSMVGRNISSSDYRYSFNGKERDSETELQDYGMRIYNERLGRFLSKDPLFARYPYLTPYAFAENDVISSVDIDGKEKYRVIYNLSTPGRITFTVVYVPTYQRASGHTDDIQYIFTDGSLAIQNLASDAGKYPSTYSTTFDYPVEGVVANAAIPYFDSQKDKRENNGNTGPLGNDDSSRNGRGGQVAQGKIGTTPGSSKILGASGTDPVPNLTDRYATNDATPSSSVNTKYLAQYLLANPDATVTVTGRTDRQGAENDNLTLSQNRANGVRDQILNDARAMGFSEAQVTELGTRINTVGAGESRAANNGDVDGSSNANERVTEVTFDTAPE